MHPDRIDVELCEATARALGEAGTLVLVGPNLLATDQAAAPATTRARVLLGPRPRDAVIGYLQHADVLVVPHVVTEFTDSLDPIKLYEYQAVGRPVVSTPVAGFRDADDPRIIDRLGRRVRGGGRRGRASGIALPGRRRRAGRRLERARRRDGRGGAAA